MKRRRLLGTIAMALLAANFVALSTAFASAGTQGDFDSTPSYRSHLQGVDSVGGE
ncbi:hypothetical protein DCOP10_10621 [Armatimonadetes bacterium DC]|mgnify:CR=1 FL=1|nr:hypothetical protein DCOP10_10621 [Armatimonadetes bacterium DC]